MSRCLSPGECRDSRSPLRRCSLFVTRRVQFLCSPLRRCSLFVTRRVQFLCSHLRRCSLFVTRRVQFLCSPLRRWWLFVTRRVQFLCSPLRRWWFHRCISSGGLGLGTGVTSVEMAELIIACVSYFISDVHSCSLSCSLSLGTAFPLNELISRPSTGVSRAAVSEHGRIFSVRSRCYKSLLSSRLPSSLSLSHSLSHSFYLFSHQAACITCSLISTLFFLSLSLFLSLTNCSSCQLWICCGTVSVSATRSPPTWTFVSFASRPAAVPGRTTTN